ncbi:MurT ligase domain-containing protein [Corynebacterium sp. UMB9976]|uniref:MurT ligase domain-containing protein n=1 Tax=Corynebacterium sp. UMB9976 TaxID=3046354 RepID=UPI00254A3AF3|nr:MurT ligase domain-containing protein [Corynebacterium sp. UMB9976]MDK6302399.1 MurT ligase domain-containing protein [Corynebacterium sp. UMB9976]
MSLRSRIACQAADLATWASQKTGRGAGGMIGGLIANAIDPNLLAQLSQGRPTVLVTGTNGKSTTTRMLAHALASRYSVATNEGGDNMDAGVISALLAGRDKDVVALEVDELHVPNIAEKLDADVLVLLNLTRDQLDRVGEINKIERALRACVEARPDMTVIANCDDVQVTSVAWDAPNVVWVSAGAGFVGDSTSCPRTGGHIVRTEDDWYAVKKLPDGREFRRPEPTWWVDKDGLGHAGEGARAGGAGASGADASGADVVSAGAGDQTLPMNLQLPGRANRGNAAQAIAAAVVMDVPVKDALRAAEEVTDVAGRYSLVEFEGRTLRLMLAKNPAGWQEALSMIDRGVDSVVIAVNGQVADGQDLSWIWDVRFEDFEGQQVLAAGERGTDLAVRLGYAGVRHTLIKDTVDAVLACPPGRVEVLANYTAFRDLKRELERRGATTVEADEANGTDAISTTGEATTTATEEDAR